MRQNFDRPVTVHESLFSLARHRGKMIGFFLTSVAVSLAWIIFAPRTYESTAELYVRLGRESVTLDPTATTGPVVQFYQTRDSEINTILQLVECREIVAKVVDRIGSGLILYGAEQASTGGEQPDGQLSAWLATLLAPLRDPECDRNRAIRKLESRTHILAPPNSSVIKIQCLAPQPELAQQIAQAWTDIVLVEHLRVTRTNRSYEFFVQQADLFQRQLDATERQLRDAKVEAGLVSLAGQETVLEQALAETRSRTAANQSALSSSTAKAEKLERLLQMLPRETVVQVVTGMPHQGWDLMRDTLYKLQANEADFNSRYTADHPRMQSMQHQRAEMEETLVSQADQRSQSARGPNPLYQTLEQDLLREQAAVAAMTAEGQSLQDRQARLEGEFTAFNEHAMRIRDLERHVAVVELKYRAHTEKMEEARIQEALETARISSVNVMQPATFIDRPTSPRKLVTLLLGLVVGVLGGVAVAMTAEYMKQPFVPPLRSKNRSASPCSLRSPSSAKTACREPTRTLNERSGTVAARQRRAMIHHTETFMDAFPPSSSRATSRWQRSGVPSGRGETRPLPLSLPVSPLPLWKRTMDIVGASLGLLLLCPLLLFVAVLIKSTSRGPIFYRQERFGAHGRPFRIWKFRSMHVDSDPDKHQQYVRRLLRQQRPMKKVDDCYGMIPLGRWLRLLAIDELPQLLNVLAGEMSLVGPRPDVIPPEEYPLWQRARFDVVPGLTGLWQVSGKNKTTFDEMVRLEIRYIQRRSLWLDLKIAVLTGPAIVRQVLEDRRAAATAPISTTPL